MTGQAASFPLQAMRMASRAAGLEEEFLKGMEGIMRNHR